MKDAHPSRRVLLPLVLLTMCLGAAWARAYNPPVDRAGPLEVRVEGPEEVTQTDTPLPVRVVLENRGEERLEGTVQLGLVDSWKAEPADAVRFAVEAKGTAACEFRVTAGAGTYSAHYPIHAWVRFQHEGEALVAHPVLILQTKLPQAPPAQRAWEWRPFAVPENGQLALWQVPVQRSVVAIFGQKPLVMPVGWQGAEPQSHGSMFVSTVTLGGATREAVAIHPPWDNGLVGTLAVEYPLELPKTGPIKLRFSHGMTPTGESDGVTFRVRVLPLSAPDGELGQVVFERHSAAKTWQDAEADLSSFAGQAVRLQLESHPGPKNNTGWDQSYWGEPTLSCGTPPEPLPFPPPDEAGSRLLGTAGREPAPCEFRLWPGRRGMLDAVVGMRLGDKRLFLRGFEARVLGARLDDARSPILLVEAKEEPCDAGCQVRHTFQSLMGKFDLVSRLYVESGVLRAEFRLENVPAPQPWLDVHLEDVAAGPWSEPARQVYAGAGNVLRDPEAFRLHFDGHQLSTSFVGMDFQGGLSLVEGVDVPPDFFAVEPAERRYSLHVPHASKWAFIPAQSAWEGARLWHDANGLKAAGGVQRAAGRFVFDLWGGRYGESAEALKRSFRYGLTDAMVMWHNWQRWGYDYRLPDIYPPNPRLGSLEEMQRLAEVCREHDVPFAPHDNYIDFYPDAQGFSYSENIAFHADGQPVRAWLNEGRGAQSYRFRADRVEPFLRRNLTLVREGLKPTGYFIDVWSSIGPYDYWTADGRFYSRVFTRTTWGEQFAWIRDFLGGNAPQISESGHDQLIGWLDGAQTNHLRVDRPTPGRRSWCVWNWPCGDAERTPWFDAAHHDRFVLHGAGYPSRYEGGLDPREHGIYSDDYMATEVLDGHPAMVPTAFGRDVVRKYWLLAELGRALALRQIEGVEYVGGDLHRQHVRWSGGGQAWVNRGQGDWTVEGTVLPQYGFLARVPTEQGPVETSIARRDGLIVETARSPRQLYFNGRQVVDGALPIRLSVEQAKYLGDRRVEFALRWQADAPIPAGWHPFLHFCDQEGEIVFQAGHQPASYDAPQQGAVAATAVTQIPADLKPGQSVELRAGIYNTATGERLQLSGPDDGTRRIRLGSLRLEGTGDELSGVAWKALDPQADPLLARWNLQNKPVDFGAVVTSGGVRLTMESGSLCITPLPAEHDARFTVKLRLKALPWTIAEPTHVEVVAEDGQVLRREPVRREGDFLAIDCAPGEFAYRLVRR